ncbi:LysR family transcriptional regulator [Kitasatospora viridis]|uniref:DNA-binding transcriptional LysR family regulator n=1 Tax=Kitasatospora viridis TaxID=281105 RepID=A0A561TT39_9ACTN|nr:LysR family transcriptional regulator [Kitasatospora viridis]TWF90282.1 DNA-binding transcriptional LysR family regulator [Kitasatospora viridis]
MELTQRLLQQVVVLAEEQHFGRAAERLGMSQPPLSQAIQRLERGLRVSLFDRGPHGARPTPAGRAFAEDARRLLDAQQAAVDRARRIAAGEQGELRLGFVGSLGYRLVPRLLRLAHAELPDLRLQLSQRPSTELLDLLRTGALDLALVRLPVADTDRLTVQQVGVERLVAVLPDRHPLAGRSSLALHDLAGEPFALPRPGALPGLARQVALACAEAGYTPQALGHADDLPGLLSYVGAGLCVAVAPEQVRSLGLPGVSCRPLDGDSPHLETTVAAVHRPEQPDAATRQVLRLLGIATATDTATDTDTEPGT